MISNTNKLIDMAFVYNSFINKSENNFDHQNDYVKYSK